MRFKIARRKSTFENRIISINVVEKVNLPVFYDNRSAVHNQHRDWSLETHAHCLIPEDGVAYSIWGPLRIVSENPCCQSQRIFEPDATMTEIPP